MTKLKIMTILTGLLLSSCGMQRQINEIRNKTNTNSSDISELTVRVNALEMQLAQDKTTLSILSDLLNQLNTQVGSNSNSIELLQTQIAVLQSSNNAILAQLAVLQGYDNIQFIKDPCGAQGGYNEVFLQLADGRYLASFSDNAAGQNTRFSLLTDGSYMTTDGTNCKFTVSGNGTIISNEHN